uniref:RNA-directed DNA polymerase, eukaryota, reverse transcriptase zinc-binding domain protein n=1 Tax=Tanacetum cinerariifolium TaxID=118510 RepID=A0A6L2MBL6_TANCI|nr:RNA-directed DNA polymerase, eukaryota, reverse transcriptase zinc-binding domain protein [Tanacetum cinerariifolium]
MTFLGYPHRFMSRISPSRFPAKDLFHSCKQYGHFVEPIIPFKRSKDGKRFGFVRFINVFNVERLVSNLCTIWVNRSKFHANIARFHRAPLNNNKVSTEQKFGYNRNINNVRAKEGVTTGSSKSYVHAVKVKNMFGALECDSMPSIVLDDECLVSKDLSNALLGRVKYFVTLPNLKIVLKNENMEVGSWFSVLKQASSDFIPGGRIVWWRLKAFPLNYGLKILLNGLPLSGESYWTLMIRKRKVFIRKEVPGRVPEFVDDSDDDDDDESNTGFKDGDVKVQDGGRCGNNSDEVEVSKTMFEESLKQKVNQSEDPFGIYLLLNKNKDKSENMKPSDHSLKYPSGFTPNGDNNEFCMHEGNVRSVNETNLLNCNMEENQNGQERNSTNKGSKEDISGSVCQWDGEVVIMGDFNEVRFKSKRFGSVFNVQGANVFNAFIANAGLEEVSLGGSSFTWCHKSATKMSKLDRNLNMIMGRFLFDFLIIGSDDIINKKLEVLNSIQHLDQIKVMDVAQKAKIKWVIEGNENTRQFWSSIENDVFAAVSYFLTFGDIPNGCNSCFIALISKVPDTNLVKDFRPISLVGIRWDFLDDILKKFGFGNKWCAWIQSCLRSSRGSIIINGSHTEEFQFFKGLKQGDPLSPFLFILIMESLHLSFQRVVDVGMFKGINLSPLVNLSHMFYADDAVFVGQWCDGNINTLVHVLECFFQASGLRINMCKSKIMGVNVGDEKVKSAASKLRCLILNTPFSYLGTKVGGNMSRVQAWMEVVDKVKSRLSNWKMKSLSIGGFMVKQKSVLASKEKGGLRVSSLYALNRALMMKWVCKFYSQKESLWARVIKAIYGDDGQVGKVSRAGSRSCWRNIVNEVRILSNQGIKVLDYMRIKLGNGESTAFWDDNWIGGKVLKYSFPRIYALETEKEVTVNSKMSDTRLENSLRRSIRGGVKQVQFNELSGMLQLDSLMPYSDRWVWLLESLGAFFVASIRKIIDDNRLSTVDTRTLWIKYVPIKVNVLAWKIKIKALPTRFNISRRGIDIDSILCPIYVNSYVEWFNWMNSLRLKSKSKLMIEVKYNKDLPRKVICYAP